MVTSCTRRNPRMLDRGKSERSLSCCRRSRRRCRGAAGGSAPPGRSWSGRGIERGSKLSSDGTVKQQQRPRSPGEQSMEILKVAPPSEQALRREFSTAHDLAGWMHERFGIELSPPPNLPRSLPTWWC